MENSQAHISRSRSGARSTTAPRPYTPQTEALSLLDLGSSEHIYWQDNHQTEESPLNPRDKKSQLPWWKTPSPWWLLIIMPFTSIAMSATIAPRIEVYTTLACSIHRPDILGESFQQLDILAFLQDSSDYRIPAVAHNSSSVDIRSDVFTIDESVPTDDSPTRQQRCASDPVVQAAVAKLISVITASMGILSCITTGWWGAFSDRYGRTSVMGISIIGLLVTDFNFIMVTLFSKHIPGGYWFLVVGPMLEGALGGMAGGVAAFHAYLADTSNESDRTRIFSLSLGLLYTGTTIGPSIGSLLIRFTGQILSVFYLGGCLHLLYSFMVWFIIPESLTKGQMELSKTRYADSSHAASRNPDDGLVARFIRDVQRLFFFLSPLAILGPIEEVNGNTLKGRKKDWNLTLVVAALGFTIALMGSYNYIFQYAAATFGWSSETLGYWMTIVSAVRVIFLALILPTGIKILKPKPLTLEISAAPVETSPLLNSSSSNSSTIIPRKTIKKEIHSPMFDLNLARLSLLADIVSYAFMGLAQSQLQFGLSSTLGSLGTGFNPAVQSIALVLYARRGGIETGKLFGALGLIQVISSQILAPFIYGFVYVNTVSTFPGTVFFVSVAAVSTSYCLLSLVRLPKDDEYHRQSLVDLEEPQSNEESSTSRAQST